MGEASGSRSEDGPRRGDGSSSEVSRGGSRASSRKELFRVSDPLSALLVVAWLLVPLYPCPLESCLLLSLSQGCARSHRPVLLVAHLFPQGGVPLSLCRRGE